MKDYIYVDELRLDAYISQLGGATTYEKIPHWSAEIGLMGPKVVASQGAQARQLAVTERLDKLLIELDNRSLLQTKNPFSAGRPFGLATFLAQRLVIRRDAALKLDGDLCIWRKVDTTTVVTKGRMAAYRVDLVLLEDFRGDDTSWIRSSKTTFDDALLAYSVELAHRYSIAPNQTECSAVDLFLTRYAAPVGKPRRIESLYRLRDGDIDDAAAAAILYGYPIYIADASASDYASLT